MCERVWKEVLVFSGFRMYGGWVLVFNLERGVLERLIVCINGGWS